VASIPLDNLAARTIGKAEAGLVVDVTDSSAFVAAAQKLLADASLRRSLGANGRAYAEKTFDIERIGDEFVGCFERLGSAQRVASRVEALSAVSVANAS
jgi:colanic acid biosynthesis glycosyl transferase WcaI